MIMEETFQTDDERVHRDFIESFPVSCYLSSCANLNLIKLGISHEISQCLSNQIFPQRYR